MTLVESTRPSFSVGEKRGIGAEVTMRVVERITSRTRKHHPDLSWQAKALCRNTNLDLFFPIGTTGRAVSQIERAQQVCLECPALEACLEYALETNQDSGVWGGHSEQERREIRRAHLR